jgi:RHS repeat-associated protein
LWAITQGADARLTFTRNNTTVTTTAPISTSAWRHVGFTYDGTSARWYLDGALDKAQAMSWPISTKAYSAVVWGNSAVGLDEAAVFSRALSGSEIATHRNAAVGSGSTAVSYAYDGDGLRKAKTVGGITTTFVWDRSGGLPMLLSETTAGATTSYVYGPDAAALEQIEPSGAVRYFVHDQLGSTVGLVDSAGTVVGTFAYDATGKPVASTGSVSTHLGFAGQYTDAETGFSFLRARYYDPATAQFLSVDPLLAFTRSAYGYAAGDPVNYTDPSGLYPGEGLVKRVFRGVACAAVIAAGVGGLVLLGLEAAPVLAAIVAISTTIALTYDVASVVRTCTAEWWSDACQQSLADLGLDVAFIVLGLRGLRLVAALAGLARIGQATYDPQRAPAP